VKRSYISEYIIENIINKIFTRLGAKRVDAKYVSKVLVETSLLGIDSHGINLLDRYVGELENKIINPRNIPSIIKDEKIFTLINGNHGFGQVTAKWAIDCGIKKARTNGISITSLTNTNHIGRVGEYAIRATKSGFMCFAVCNAGANVAPYGSYRKLIGTNPITFSCPTPDDEPFLMDMATSIFPEGKVKSFLYQSMKLPNGVVIDKFGQNTNEPADLYDGGSLLPIGLYKGFGLSIMIEILAGIFSGAGSSVLNNCTGANGAFFLVLNPYQFINKEEYNDTISRFIKTIISQPVIEGFDEILIPGEPERIIKKQRKKEGIPIYPKMWNDIIKITDRYGIKVDFNPRFTEI
jgi:L-2-hydroxycarboxylate dehydrogenase (NAD+)